ncbi:Splicing factor ESS-2 [Phytophthora citrophthora]|uniref:Splicing factor ESS-2 n=1 Tax=Phytophthora citrophthora TaxID=4793 RepID=A0AAD9H0E7_9STRA|nr:Splicing factor ESS-2 [Phytophthora citrophthora]
MEATAVYPNTVPALAANGLGVSLAGTDPDHVPLQPDLVNDSRRRFVRNGSAVDASGVMRLHVRNALGYAFLRPYHQKKLILKPVRTISAKEDDWKAQATYYRTNYRHYVPHDLMMDYLENECPPQEDCSNLSKWQGNAIAGVDCGEDGHVVFYPTGHVLQQACAWYSKGESGDDPPSSSTVIETGTRIHQFTVMGSKDAYHPSSSSKIYAATRGNTQCTVIAAPARLAPENVHKMQAKAKISFPGLINHIAGSPHAEADLALITVDGTVRCWDPEGGIQIVAKDFHMQDRFLRCEYASHPCVLWATNRVSVSTLDLRQPVEHTSMLYDVSSAGGFVTIYDLKRRASNPFQFVVGTGVSIEVVDSRMARQPLISWRQPPGYNGERDFSFGVIDEVGLSRNCNESRGYIVSSARRSKVTTLFPFERNRKRKRGKVMSLTSLRYSAEDDEYSVVPRSSTEQLVASDSTLDLRMEDGGECTHLTGICALRDGSSDSASIFQLNSLGDLFSHRVSFSCSQTKSYRTAVQPDLPSGMTTQDDTWNERSRSLPIAVDAILQEHDTESLQMFNTLPVKLLRQQFPRLPNGKEGIIKEEIHEGEPRHVAAPRKTQTEMDVKSINGDAKIIRRFQQIPAGYDGDRKGDDAAIPKLRGGMGLNDTKANLEVIRRFHQLDKVDENEIDEADKTEAPAAHSQNFDENELINKLLDICDPSASLFRLHRYVLEELNLDLSSSDLLLLLRTSQEFRIRTVHHGLPADTLRVRNPSLPGADDVHFKKDDPRLAVCSCGPDSELPCDSLTCVLPHAVVVSSTLPEILLDDTAPTSAVTQEIPQDLAGIITAAQAVYDDIWTNMSKKVVLEEEDYVETLGQIIERDFFPDIPKLKEQTERLRDEEDALPWTDTTLRVATISRANASVRGNSSGTGWDQPTPTLEQLKDGDGSRQEENTRDDTKASMTLNRFVATHTSEDNKAFIELQEKTVKDHQRRYHWAFDDDKERGDPKLHLLTNGEWISKDQRQIADEVCAPKGPKDDRPSAPETWKYRARNPLLFPPELEATRDICQVNAGSKDQLLLESESKARTGLPPRSRKTTIYANSRFSSDTQLIGSESGGVSSSSQKDYSLVPMTPLIAPGVDASPLMTWGDIEATPTNLEHALRTPSFEVQDTPRREKLASRLESEAKSKFTVARNQNADTEEIQNKTITHITQCPCSRNQCPIGFTHPIGLRPAVASKLFYAFTTTTSPIQDTEDEVNSIFAQKVNTSNVGDYDNRADLEHTCQLDSTSATNLITNMTTAEEVYKAVVVGGGPGGIGVFVRAARAGLLPRLLNPEKFGTAKDNELSTQLDFKQMGVAVLHAGDVSSFGGGNLGEYIINSNTFACGLLASVLDEKPDLDPPESIKDTFLEKVRAHESAKRMEEIGAAPGNLTEIGRFLRQVGACLIDEIADKAPETSTILLNTTATKYEALENGLIRVEGNSGGNTVVLHTEHLILAMGGTQELPSLDNPAYHSKLFGADSCLREDGFAKLKHHLLAQPVGERKVCIVGGSHSSFSVAWLLLNKLTDPKAVTVKKASPSSISPKKKAVSETKKSKEESETTFVAPHLASIAAPVTATVPVPPLSVTKCEMAPSTASVKIKRTTLTSTSGEPASPKTSFFNPKEIMILHRSPIRCYYGSTKEAEADGADATRVDRSGCVNTFTGLREDAKRLYKSVSSGREVRVRLFQVNQQGSQTLVDKAYSSAGAIVWGAGYKTNLLSGFDEAGNPLTFHQVNGVVKLDNKARLQLLGPFKGKSPSVLGLGLGFSLRSAVDEMGTETRVDGVTVYHRRGALLALEALFGPEVYGTSSSFEEMVEKQEKKKREAQALKVEKAVEKARNATAGEQTSASPSKGNIARSDSVTTPHVKLVPLFSPTSVGVRRGSSKPTTASAAVSDKKSPKKKDLAATNPPVKLLLLRRRASADEATAAATKASEPPELLSSATPEPTAAAESSRSSAQQVVEQPTA